jgi:hypothetical protein
MGNIEFKKSSDVSGYLTIGDWKLYIEVSDATEVKPYISAWLKDTYHDKDGDVYEYEVTS